MWCPNGVQITSIIIFENENNFVFQKWAFLLGAFSHLIKLKIVA